ncbi:MAG TPA: NAD(P)-binding oxidoreductase [Jatrophihabitans sp.]|jgi:putative NADH-flavin reductase|uniref:NAD(P)-dependent oxidoreductase n=1 Tax=Jatrophihabitans sp. TaxID=1932789 RepID=UPI002F0F1035
MKICVLGATGRTGKLVVGQAHERGIDVTALVRDPARLGPTRELVNDVTPIDADDAVLTAALAGSVALVSALGPLRETPRGELAGLLTRILESADRAGVSRVVSISAAPISPPPAGESAAYRRVVLPAIRRVFRLQYQELALMDAALMARPGLDWTILRPPRLTNSAAAQSYRAEIGGPAVGGRTVTRAGLAKAVLDSLARPDWSRQIVGLAAG